MRLRIRLLISKIRLADADGVSASELVNEWTNGMENTPTASTHNNACIVSGITIAMLNNK